MRLVTGMTYPAPPYCSGYAKTYYDYLMYVATFSEIQLDSRDFASVFDAHSLSLLKHVHNHRVCAPHSALPLTYHIVVR
jgi:hypothetical protein